MLRHIKTSLLVFLLSSTAAFTQQQSPSERAIVQKLMVEINAGLQCNTQLVSANDQIAQLQKELADEKAKNVKQAVPK